MTPLQQMLIIGLAALATMATRFLPFLLFSDRRPVPGFIRYLGRALPSAVFAMLLVYSLRGVSLTSGSRGLPEILALLATAGLYWWKKGMILPVAGGTLFYIFLIHSVF